MTKPEVIIGVDIHKYSHTAVGINLYGEEVFQLDFSNRSLDKMVTSLKEIQNTKQLMIGLEDINGYGKKLQQTLVIEGFEVYHIPPVMTDRERKKTSHRNKSDYLDAKGVAKATLLAHRALPQVILTQEKVKAEELKSIVDDREDLVARQTELKNQLHNLLHEILGDDYKFGKRNIFSKYMISMYEKKLLKKSSYQSRRIKRKLRELKHIQEMIKELENELQSFTDERLDKLNNISGCGRLTACKVVAEIKDITKFSKESKLARYSGLAPRESSSGKSGRMYTDRAGNRKLNKAIHTIALSQIGNRGNKKSRRYYEKKKNEGKSNLHALRCLKRQVVKEIYRTLLSC